MIAHAAAPAAAIAARPPTRATSSTRPPLPRSRPARQIDRRQYTASAAKTIASTTDARREERDLGRLADGEEVRREGDRPDDGDDQEDGTGRDPPPALGRVVPIVVAGVVVVFAVRTSVRRGIWVATGAAVGHAGSSSEGPMVDRDVVGQPRPGQPLRDRPAGITERRLEERPGLVRSMRTSTSSEGRGS